jgi:integrase
MRFSEIMNLQWDHVDLDRGVAILYETKNGEIGRVPLSGHALQLLRDLGKVRRIDSQLLFPSAKDPSKPADIRAAWEFA